MERFVIVLFFMLFIFGCGNNDSQQVVEQDNSELVYQKEKDCFNMKSKYIDYLYKKHNLSKDLNITELKKQGKAFKILNNDEKFFYSKTYDKCIGAYRIIDYDPVYENGEISCYTDDGFYYIVDIINDEELYVNFEVSSDCYGKTTDEMREENRVHLLVLSDWESMIKHYRTGEYDKYL